MILVVSSECAVPKKQLAILRSWTDCLDDKCLEPKSVNTANNISIHLYLVHRSRRAWVKLVVWCEYDLFSRIWSPPLYSSLLYSPTIQTRVRWLHDVAGWSVSYPLLSKTGYYLPCGMCLRRSIKNLWRLFSFVPVWELTCSAQQSAHSWRWMLISLCCTTVINQNHIHLSDIISSLSKHNVNFDAREEVYLTKAAFLIRHFL
jgi:hypothetical protein